MTKHKSLLLNLVICFAFCCNSSVGLAQGTLSDHIEDYTGDKTISMDFTDALLNDVLKIFSQQSGLNFICSTSVSDKIVNLYLDKVPVEEALERILSANGLTYELKSGSNIFVVKELPGQSTDLMTRVYTLKYASVSTAKIISALSTDSGGEEESGDSLAGGIISTIEAILTERGSVVEDPRTNSLIITDAASQFPIIEQTISMLDVRVPLVSIEVDMLDVSRQSVEQIGVKFGETPVEFYGASKLSTYPFKYDNVADDAGGTLTFTDAQGEEIPQYTASQISFTGLNFILQFLRSQTDTRNLARPRILTLNNETAEIRIRTDEAIGISAETISAEGTASSSVTAERVETGVFLTVTPQANLRTGEITMVVEPRVVEAKTGGTFDGTTFKDPEERGVKSIMRVMTGDTIVIGGLLRSDKAAIKTRVPWFSRIPIIKNLFKHDDKTGLDRELLVFISPKIVEDGEAQFFMPPPQTKGLIEQLQLEEIEKHLQQQPPDPPQPPIIQTQTQQPRPAPAKTKKQVKTFNDMVDIYGDSQRKSKINKALQELENTDF